jgi:hypothetical protein
MQTTSHVNFGNDIPPAFFPDDAMECPPIATPVVPAARAPRSVAKAKAVEEAVRAALRIVRAKSGETEMRLFKETAGSAVRYVVSTVVLAPYQVSNETLKVGKKFMTKEEAHAEFDRRVALKYPPVVLKHNGKQVAIHIDLS